MHSMSESRKRMRAEHRISLVKASNRVLKTFDCAHCQRVSLEIMATGKMVWTDHGHPQVTTMHELFNFYLSITNTPTLIDLRRKIDERLKVA